MYTKQLLYHQAPRPAQTYLHFFFWYQVSNLGPCAYQAGGGTAELNPWPQIYLFEEIRLSCRILSLDDLLLSSLIDLVNTFGKDAMRIGVLYFLSPSRR